jgi:hypothetical protein
MPVAASQQKIKSSRYLKIRIDASAPSHRVVNGRSASRSFPCRASGDLLHPHLDLLQTACLASSIAFACVEGKGYAAEQRDGFLSPLGFASSLASCAADRRSRDSGHGRRQRIKSAASSSRPRSTMRSTSRGDVNTCIVCTRMGHVPSGSSSHRRRSDPRGRR